MGRTVLYILIGVSVVGALAVLLLINPLANDTTTSADVAATTPRDTAVSEQAVAGQTDNALPETTQSEATDASTPASPDTQNPVTATPAEETTSVPSEGGYSIDGAIVSGEYRHEMTLAGIDIYWTNDAEYLRMGLVSPGTGYVAIGFEPERQMQGANFIIGAVHEGELTIRDDYGHEAFAHMDDTARGGTDDIVSAAGNEWPDQTVLEFIIPLDSGDAMDTPLLPGHEITILVAYHSLLDSFSNPHTRKGIGTLLLDPA
jgi:hypothetical protein